MNMRCERTRERLSAYLDNELDPVTALDVAKHLEECPGCRRESAHLFEVGRALKRAMNSSALQTDLDARAARINAEVRARILAEIGTSEAAKPEAVPTDASSNVARFERPRRSLHRGFRRLAVVAASFIAVAFLAVFGFLSYIHNEGPLLAATARNHTVCRRIEKTGIGWKRGDKAGELMGAHGMRCPNLERMGLTLEAAHNCTISGKSLVHMMYLKDGKQVSVYYGWKDAVGKLREAVGGDLTPGKVYCVQNDGVCVAAFAAADTLWMVAGEVPAADLEPIAGHLRDTAFNGTASK